MINLLENTIIPENCILTTIDVKSLYLNIPHQEGIEAVINRLYHKNNNVENVAIPSGTMKDLLNIVLAHNYFQFSDFMYHQIQGTAMGTKMAPAYANIFMAELEEKLLEQYPVKPILWKRYIDDVLCLWPGNIHTLKTFIDYLNESHNTIKFTYEASTTSIDFLDITIYKGKRYQLLKTLDIKPFFKKTNKFQYLQYSSAHPKSTFSSLIKGELTRLLRCCSDIEEFTKIKHKMHKIFRDRGYPASLINKIEMQVPFHLRPQSLTPKPKSLCPYDTFLVIEYTPDTNITQLRKTLKPTETEIEQVPTPCLSLKKQKTIGKTLVKAKLKNKTSPVKATTAITLTTTPNFDGHSGGCGNNACKCCNIMSRKTRIISTSNHKSFPTPKQSNCNTKNVIYLLECTKCNKRNQYVGQTERLLSQRLAGHRAAARIKTTLPLYKHL